MTDEQLDLARRAVACKHWRWMPGMLDAVFGRVVAVHEDEIVFADCRVAAFAKVQPDSPDVDDHATIGCLLALVREAWGDQDAWIQPCHHDDGGKVAELVVRAFCGGSWSRELGCGLTPQATLVAALEAAP